MLTQKQIKFLQNNEGLLESGPRLIDLRDCALASGLSGLETSAVLILFAEATKNYLIEIKFWATMVDNDHTISFILENTKNRLGDYVTLDYGSCDRRLNSIELVEELKSMLKRKFKLEPNQVKFLVKTAEVNSTSY